jgi:hypothetical protein
MNQKSRSICRKYCWSITIIIVDEHSPDIGHGTSCTMPMRNNEDDVDDDDGDWKSKAMMMRRPLLLLTMLQRRLEMLTMI